MSSGLNPVQQEAHDSSRAHLLSYDMHPELVGGKQYDPSARLWQLGARLTESVWVIPDKNVPRLPLAEWGEKYGMEADLVRFDERDADAIKTLAMRGVRREALRVRASLEKTKAELEVLIASGLDDATKKKKRGTAMNALWRARKAMESLTECSLMFDLMGDAAELLNSVKHIVRVHDGLFYSWFKEENDPTVAVEPEAQPEVAADEQVA
jgi:hypothetical protein